MSQQVENMSREQSSKGTTAEHTQISNPETNSPPVVQRPGILGQTLFKVKPWLIFYLIVVCLYIAATIGFITWAFKGPALLGARRVLLVGDITVNQFYSGLALSAFLTPAAVVTRKIGSECTLIYPFSIAAKKHVKTKDLDRILNGGFLALSVLFRYSRSLALSQGFILLFGTTLVPIGTLILTTGPYEAPVSRNESVPIIDGLGLQPGSQIWDGLYKNRFAFTNGSYKFFDGTFDNLLTTVTNSAQSQLVSDSMVLHPIPATLGPTHLLHGAGFQNDGTYNGLLTYSWDSYCESAVNDIVVHDADKLYEVMFEFPDGSYAQMKGDAVLWSNAHIWEDYAYLAWLNGSESLPCDGTIIFLTSGYAPEVKTWNKDTSNLIFSHNYWFSMVKCTPQLRWGFSSCVWTDGGWEDCVVSTTPPQSKNIYRPALDALSYYMTATVWSLGLYRQYDAWGTPTVQNRNVIVLGEEGDFLTNCLAGDGVPGGDWIRRAPGIDDHDMLFGAVANSIAKITLNGRYGTMEVPMTGHITKQVYIIRMYILAIIFGMLTTVFVLSTGYIVYLVRNKLPVREATFLSIATAVRGKWWDRELYGGCALSDSELKRICQGKVMFGVDPDTPNHIGLAPDVLQIDPRAEYFGREYIRRAD